MRPPPPPLRRRRPDRGERATLPFASSRWCHLVVYCSSIVLFQNRLGALVSGDVINNGGGIPGIADDIIVTDKQDRRSLGGVGNEQISVEMEPEKAKGISWEGDDDDDDDDSVATAVVDVAGNKDGENDVSAIGEDTIEFPAGRQNGKVESGIGASNVADGDEFADADIGHAEGGSLGQVSAEDETKVTPERPDDDDATVKNSASDALVNTEITLGENVDPTPGQVSVEGRHDRPDDDDDVADEILSESVKTIISENEIGAGDSQKEVTASKKVLPLDDDDVTNIVGGSKEIDDLGVPSPTNIDGSEDNLALSSLHSQPTTFHRSQSSEGDAVVEGEGALVEDEKVKVEVPEKDATGPEKAGDSTQETVRNDTGAENGNDHSVPLSDTNVGNGGSDLSILTEDNTNVALEGKPSEQMLPGSDQTQQPPIQDWDDEDEDSLFEMLQSTFNVILLAVGLTSFLVFRKRVKDRVLADPSIHVASAIKDEIIDVVIRLASWATGTSNGAKKNVSNAEVGNETSTGFGNETIPLSTATDEEWGWEDEDMGTKLELSAMRGDEAKEDDDLAMAIAMSISDSRNSSDEAMGTTASVLKPKNPSTMNGSKYSPSTGKDKTLRSSTTPKFSSTSFETQSYSAGGDSIADLLGQMGSNGGPVITSFGQKPSTITKPKSQPKNESADDIFASMGLSTSYSSTTARPAPKSVGWQASTSTQSKTNAPKSTPLSSLLADTYDGDVDADTWGDGGDLDDLLD
jgi:hypothetical protein